MRLIGMLDSPYVRRVAVSLRLLELPFEHEALSVFSTFDAFAAINPVVKAPTLILDNGTALMESILILDHLDRLAAPALRLEPEDIAEHGRAQRVVGLALAACEKSVQLVYEDNLRPAEKKHMPWVDRVTGQLATACRLLEAELPADGAWLFGGRPMQADVTTAVAWRFVQEMRPGLVDQAAHPKLAALSGRAEALPAFLAAPFD